jgi:uncharacterized protein YhfF
MGPGQGGTALPATFGAVVNHDLPITQFGLSAADMDSTALEVLMGDKRATTGLHAAYLFDDEPLPQVGNRSMVHDSRGREIAIIEVTKVEIRRYCDVDATYAAIEGEGDKSLAYWQRVHLAYFGAECRRIGIAWHEQQEVVLEYFKTVQTCLSPEEFRSAS